MNDLNYKMWYVVVMVICHIFLYFQQWKGRELNGIFAIHRGTLGEDDIKEMKDENKAIYKIATSVEVMAEKLGNIEDKVDETKRKVDETADAQRATEERFLQRINEVENAPATQTAQNINTIKVEVITAIITFIATGILGAIVYFVK